MKSIYGRPTMPGLGRLVDAEHDALDLFLKRQRLEHERGGDDEGSEQHSQLGCAPRHRPSHAQPRGSVTATTTARGGGMTIRGVEVGVSLMNIFVRRVRCRRDHEQRAECSSLSWLQRVKEERRSGFSLVPSSCVCVVVVAADGGAGERRRSRGTPVDDDAPAAAVVTTSFQAGCRRHQSYRDAPEHLLLRCAGESDCVCCGAWGGGALLLLLLLELYRNS